MGDEPGEYAASIAAWDAERDARLRSPKGWLALVGLHWLTEGSQAVGSDPANPIHLIGRGVPPHAGSLEVTDGEATYRPSPEFASAAEVPLTDDLAGAPTIVELGLAAISPDSARRPRSASGSATRRHQSSNPSPASRASRWIRHGGSRDASSGRRACGRWTCPTSWATSARRSRPASSTSRSTAETSPSTRSRRTTNALWLIFGDTTNGQETYSGGRFLVSEPVAEDGSVVVDFNLAYNPPCVFSPYATCPLPWPANVLPVAVRAGERMPAQSDR